MRSKECIVCSETFYYKNKSKKTCSDACRKQLSRDRRSSDNGLSGIRSIQNDYDSFELDTLVTEMFHICIIRTLSFFEGNKVQLSDVRHLLEMLDALEHRINNQEDFFEVYSFLERVSMNLEDHPDDHRIFNKKGLKKELKKLNEILNAGF